jgi:hypothetical protein
MIVPNPDSTMAAEAPRSNRLRISITTKKGALPNEYATSREVAPALTAANGVLASAHR